MTNHELSVLGEVCPFCLMILRRELKKLPSGDTLVVTVDHPPAADVNFPEYLKKEGHPYEKVLLEPGVWQFTITKA